MKMQDKSTTLLTKKVSAVVGRKNIEIPNAKFEGICLSTFSFTNYGVVLCDCNDRCFPFVYDSTYP